jgi:hypothetical protein
MVGINRDMMDDPLKNPLHFAYMKLQGEVFRLHEHLTKKGIIKDTQEQTRKSLEKYFNDSKIVNVINAKITEKKSVLLSLTERDFIETLINYLVDYKHDIYSKDAEAILRKTDSVASLQENNSRSYSEFLNQMSNVCLAIFNVEG